MNQSIRRDPPSPVLVVAGMLAGAAAWALLLYVALSRVAYPFELEWIEGSSVDHVVRILRGQKLYVEPSPAFVPQLYTPLYFYVSAAMALVTGVGFLPLRLVSLLAALGVTTSIFAIVRRLSSNTPAAFIASGLFCATYAASGTWFEVAHSDSLMLCCYFVALLALTGKETRAAAVIAGLSLALAFFAKQTAAVLAASWVAAALLARPRFGMLAAAVAAVTVGIGWFTLDWLHDGWMSFYTYEVPKSHSLVPEMWSGFWTEDLLRQVPLALILAAVALTLGSFKNGRERGAWTLILLGALAASWLGRLHSGGFINTLMPIHALLAVLTGVAWGFLVNAPRPFVRYGLGLLALGQFAMLAYDPRPYLPSDEDRAAGEALIARLEAVPGPVFVPFHGYYATLAGKPMHAHFMAMGDVKRADEARGTELESALDRMLANRRFEALVLDRMVMRKTIQTGYRDDEPPVPDETFVPVVGNPVQLRYFMVPRE